MWFSKDKDPLATIKKAIEAKDSKAIDQGIEDIVQKYGLESEVTHKLVVIIQNEKLPYLRFLHQYVLHNPKIISSAQLVIAEYYITNNMPDTGSAEARNFLRKLFTRQDFKDGTAAIELNTLGAQAFMHLSAVYTYAGARSYSLRLLERALSLQVSQATRAWIENETNNLRKELNESPNAAIDKKWEEFFTQFKNASELYEHCEKLGFELLARRVDLLESNYRFNASYKITPDEVLLEVFHGKDKESGKTTSMLL